MLFAADHWCGQFAPIVTGVGAMAKVSDVEIIALVAERTAPTEWQPAGMAMRRADLVYELEEKGMTASAAYARLRKMARSGLLGMTEDPPLPKGVSPGLWLWVPEERAEVVRSAPGRPRVSEPADLLWVMQPVATQAHALSLRKIHLLAQNTMTISLSTVSRLMKELVAAGLVGAGPKGYYVTDAGADVPTQPINRPGGESLDLP